jgi:hypothetical protein
LVVTLGQCRISREWVTSSGQGKSDGWVVTSSLWTGMFWDGCSSIPDERYTAVTLSSLPCSHHEQLAVKDFPEYQKVEGSREGH